ncbi:exo-alpha-sialidase [Mixta calida]|uniref:tail fiber/spike domain-containing protein n=1 Tax=Mixta calida TaxID=665913 RepID=UPI003CED0437
MATQPTQNPVPSESPRDLKFNAGKIDEFVTSLALKYQDRFGTEHYTIEGLRQLAQEAIAAFGWIPVDSFQDGATLTLPNQVLRWAKPDGDGEYYRWDGALPKEVPPGSAPASTGGVGKGAWLSVGDAALREQLGQISLLRFKDVNAIFSGITSGGITVSLKAGDNVITDGGTIWEVTNANPSSLSDIAATSPYNVIDFGADKTGVNDSTDAFIQAGSCEIPSGTYKVNSNLEGVYQATGPVVITGDGSVKTVVSGLGKRMFSLPYYHNNNKGGSIYTTGTSNYTAISGEYYREPSFAHSSFNDRTYLVYVVLEGTKFDPGQNAEQTSRIELRYSNNNLTFGSPVILSTEGEQQAAEPSIVFDEKRGRLWVFYTTARGKVGVGHGSVGFSPDKTFQNWVTYSDDYGTSWSTPDNITSRVKPYSATSAWTPPSPICITGDGDLLVPYTTYDGIFSANYIRVSANSSGSINYERQLIIRGGPEGSDGGGEHQLIQLGDGSLLCMLRDYFDSSGNTIGRQQFFRSWDGVTWVKQSSVDTVNCKAGLCSYSNMVNGDSRSILLMTAPTGSDDSLLARENLKLWYSFDNAKTWTKLPGALYEPATLPAGYSSVTTLASGSILIVAEGLNLGVLQVKHKAIGALSLSSSFAKSWGALQVTQTAGEAALCQYFDIPNYTTYFNTDTATLNMNSGGTAVQLTDSRKEVDITSATSTLNSDIATTFYLTVSMTLNSITGTARRVVLVSTSSAQPVTLAEDSTVAIGNRIRVSKILSGKVVVLCKTKYGWFADSGLN